MSTPIAEPTLVESPPPEKLPFRRSGAAVLAAAVIASAAVTGLLYAAGVAGGASSPAAAPPPPVPGLLSAVGVAGGSTTTFVAPPPQASVESSAGGALNASSLFASAAPGVVAIEATGTNSGSNGLPYTPPGQSTDTGTGMVISSQGDLLTASHVVAGASTITVKFLNGTVRTATVLGTDTSNDASVLHVNPSGLTLHPVVLGSIQ